MKILITYFFDHLIYTLFSIVVTYYFFLVIFASLSHLTLIVDASFFPTMDKEDATTINAIRGNEKKMTRDDNEKMRENRENTTKDKRYFCHCICICEVVCKTLGQCSKVHHQDTIISPANCTPQHQEYQYSFYTLIILSIINSFIYLIYYVNLLFCFHS